MSRKSAARTAAHNAAVRSRRTRPATCRACHAYGLPLNERRLCATCAQLNPPSVTARYRATTWATPVEVRHVPP